jgi:hypothetical protein
MSSQPISENGEKRHLAELRGRLLALHKVLIESERIGYEQTFGTLESKQQFLQLLIDDPWFAWLRPLSALLAAIDEALDAEPDITPRIIQEFHKQTRQLLVASEEGDGFSRSYFDALQREPDVVLAHAAVVKCLPSSQKGKS